MGGFASLLGGMAEPAQKYGAQQRELGLQTWSIQHKAALDSIDQEIARNEVPERLADLYNFRKKVATTRPGDDISKLWQDYQAHTNLHPATADALTPKPPPKSPGPAQPGQVPGTPQISPVAAQPTGSPVQPDTQGPNLLYGLLSQPAPTPQVGPTIQAAQSGVQPVQGAPADSSQTPGHGMTPMLAGSYGAQLLERISNFRKAGFSPPPQLVAEAQPYLANEAELARAKGLTEFQLGQKKVGFQAIKESPSFKNLLPYQQAGYEAESYGLSPINTPGFAMMPRLVGSGVPGHTAKPDQLDISGNPVDPKGFYRVMEYPTTGEQMWSMATPPTTMTQTPGGLQVSNRVTGEHIAPVQGAIPPVMNTPKIGTTDSGGEVLYTPAGLGKGQAPTVIPGVVNPSTLPSVHEGFTTIQTVKDGVPVTELVPTTTTTRKGGAGIAPISGAAPKSTPQAGTGAGGRTFEKPLTPLQTLTETQKYEQLNTAMDRAKRVLDNSHLLDSMIESGKLELQLHDGVLSQVLSRAFKLTPQEAQLATDFNSLRESVNLIRGALGATGFRGPEAFSALQAQRGKLLGNPQVTRGALNTFIKELQNQAQPIARKLRLGDQAPPPASDPAGLRHLLGK